MSSHRRCSPQTLSSRLPLVRGRKSSFFPPAALIGGNLRAADLAGGNHDRHYLNLGAQKIIAAVPPLGADVDAEKVICSPAAVGKAEPSTVTLSLAKTATQKTAFQGYEAHRVLLAERHTPGVGFFWNGETWSGGDSCFNDEGVLVSRNLVSAIMGLLALEDLFRRQRRDEDIDQWDL
jgi:hypothetical protein